MRALSRTEGSLKWWFFACLLAIAVGIGFMGFNQWATTQDKYVAQANAETLAQDINSICKSEGKFLLNNRDVCNKGADVLENPTAAIAGPKGDPGKDGEPGRDGVDGSNGIDGKNGADSKVPGPPGTDGTDGSDSTVPGPPGADGTNGLNGADSTVPGPQGEQGEPGADSTVPGPQGEQGEQGEPGESPSSFTWTDSKTGAKYTCYPDPVGSTTYACTEEQTVPKP